MTRISFDWAPARQALGFGREVFTHDGPPTTRAEHDVAHLMIAHNGGMFWLPSGFRDDVCFAEFNAVQLEMLLQVVPPGVTFEAHIRQSLPSVILHMEWFVNMHYAPFPCSLAEAMAMFWADLRPARLAPLVPWFQRVQQADQTQCIYEEFDV